MRLDTRSYRYSHVRFYFWRDNVRCGLESCEEFDGAPPNNAGKLAKIGSDARFAVGLQIKDGCRNTLLDCSQSDVRMDWRLGLKFCQMGYHFSPGLLANVAFDQNLGHRLTNYVGEGLLKRGPMFAASIVAKVDPVRPGII